MDRPLALIVTLKGLPTDGFASFEGRNEVRIAKQSGKESLDPRLPDKPDHQIEYAVEIRPHRKTGEPDFFGPEVFGTPDRRFLYARWLCNDDGQEVCFRRLKIDLSGITWEILESGSTLSLSVLGTAKDGGPACATAVRLGQGWTAAL